jgi:hypothetical protein
MEKKITIPLAKATLSYDLNRINSQQIGWSNWVDNQQHQSPLKARRICGMLKMLQFFSHRTKAKHLFDLETKNPFSTLILPYILNFVLLTHN